MSQICKIQININNISKKVSNAIIKSLEPDNVNFPKNLTLQVNNTSNNLTLNFKNSGNITKLANTIDEVLEHVYLVIEVINHVRS